MGDFKSGLSGISCDSGTVKSLQYIAPVSKIVETINDIKEDNFYHSDGTSLSEVADTLEKLNTIVTNNTYFYLCNGDKQTLIKKIIDDLETLKSEKMGVEPSKIGKDVSTYNDNVEAAILCNIADQEVTALQGYKDNPYDLVVRIFGTDKCGDSVSEDLTVGVVSGYNYSRKSASASKVKYQKGYSVVKKDDGFTVPSKFDGKKVSASDKATAKSNYEEANKILKGRQRATSSKFDAHRPGDSSY